MNDHPHWQAWRFTLCTTLAALLALRVAVQMNIEHPWWAAMTVWLVMQPSRGLLLERSLIRLAGSSVGAAVGYGLLEGLKEQPFMMLLGLILWAALCTGAGAMLRHFRNYGFVLAGYTAGIVVLFGVLEPGHQAPLALGRVMGTWLGIIAIAIFSTLLLPRTAPDEIACRLRELLVQAVVWLGNVTKGAEHDRLLIELHQLLSQIGVLEPQTDEAAAGSLRAHADARQQRRVLMALIGLLASGYRLLSARRPAPVAQDAISSTLTDAAAIYKKTGDVVVFAHTLSQCAGSDSEGATALSSSLQQLAIALSSRSATPLAQWQPDWCVAGVVATRAALTVMLAATLWWLTDWQYGPIMMMTATLFACLFSNNDRAIVAIHDVLKGSLLGAALGIASSLWLLPFAEGLQTQIWLAVPVLILGSFLMGHSGTAKMAIDLNMTFLLVFRPGLADHGTVVQILLQALAILAGVTIAILMYHRVFPATPSAKLVALTHRIARQLDYLAREPRHWRHGYQRLLGQVLRMTVLAELTDRRSMVLLQQALQAVSDLSSLQRTDTHSLPSTTLTKIPPLVSDADALRLAALALSSPVHPRRTS